MAKTKTLVISGPIDAKHVGGINVMGGQQPSMLDNYFSKNALEPDQLPSHTFVATGNIEVPRRSDTIAGTIRRPSVAIRRSLSRLRRSSISHPPEPRSVSETRGRGNTDMNRSDSERSKSARPLRMQSSLSRLRQRVGLDRDIYPFPPASKSVTPEPEAEPEQLPEAAPTPIQKDYPPLQIRRSTSSRVASYTSKYSEPDVPLTNTSTQPRQPPVHRKPSTIHRRPSPTSHPVATSKTTPTPPVRPKRADSGTAIAFDKVPAQERPLPFQDIMAVQSLAERMALYKKTREYWAYADHGLVEWTGRAGGPKVMVASRA
ncbi:hypothetical protein IQ06DRAFT_369254 [Phaeosphaeriaceae sp. SRC1lsM3a]|nr:hypothetical protein IQ06DRAFT_369254 [Stagonospora sp. SRC1lsM3a]